jgi:1-acyl-sn-glycerol-3-phosphate acyltransferase
MPNNYLLNGGFLGKIAPNKISETIYNSMTSKFDSIRPYDDNDLPEILKKLANTDELIESLVAFRFSSWPFFLRPFLYYLTKQYVRLQIKDIRTMREFQGLVEPYMRRMIKKTTASFKLSGFEQLNLSKPCLFISNHRDIALDPAFINWALHLNGQDTVQIAVGDNLLRKDWIADLIRLNKCFIVNRSAKDRRQKLADAKLLSEYMADCLHQQKQHIWIAQREGRAKDGHDITNPAIISMLVMNKPKDQEFKDYIKELRIVPVSISYEFDPCDVTKAKELQETERGGTYDKADHEDIKSIVDGIVGFKGQVHVDFGKVIEEDCVNAKEVANYLDQHILAAYKTYATSYVAAKLLDSNNVAGTKSPVANEDFSEAEILAATTYFEIKTAGLLPEVRIKILKMYAATYQNQQKQSF